LHTLEGHTGSVSSLAFSRDSSKIISGSNDHTVRIWDVVTGALLKTLRGHRGSVKSVAVSFDDSMIISGSADDTNDTIRVWDMVTGALLRVLEPHSAILSVASSPKTHWIVSSGDSHVIQIWDISDGTLLRTLKGHTSEVSSVAFSTSGEWIVSGAQDQTVRLWHAESGSLQATFEGHRRRVSTVAFSPDDKRIISGSDDCTARVWDMASGSLVLTRIFDDPVWSVTHFPLTNEVASALGSEIKTWDVATGNVLRTLEARDTGVQFLALSQDGTRIASGGFNQKMQIWQAQAASPETDRPWKVGLVKFSPDGLHAVSSLICRIDIWNAMTGSLLRTLKGHTSSITTIAFSANSAKLLSGSGDRTIRLWELDTGITLRKFDGHSATVVSAEFSRGGAQIVSSSRDGTIRIWDTATGVTVQTITIGVQIHFTCAALFPNGEQFAVAVDNVVQIWDLVSGDLQKTLEGYWSQVLEIAFSVDGTQIASSCYDGTVHMWNGATGAELQAFKTQGTPCGLMYSSDEKSIFTKLGPITIPKELVPVRKSYNAAMQPSTHNPGYFMRDGWLWTQRPERRICWIPPAWRPRELMFCRDLLTWSGHHAAIGTADKIIFIDTTDLAIYLNHLY
jgi:WD40 repeat protein